MRAATSLVPPPPLTLHRFSASAPPRAVNVTIPPKERVRFGLHPHADYFAFIYPVDASPWGLTDEQIDELDNSTIPALLIRGGFLYVNNQGIIQDVRAVTDNGPTEMTWAPACPLGAPAQHELKEQMRFRKVTLPEMRAQGARSFAWINPGEFAGNLGATESPLGSFAYAPKDDGDGDGFYFALTLGASRPVTERVLAFVEKVKSERRELHMEQSRGNTSSPGTTRSSPGNSSSPAPQRRTFDERLARLEEISKDKAAVLLFECIEKGEHACVKQLLDELQMTADVVDRAHRSALQFACRLRLPPGVPKEQQLLMVQLLLDRGAVMNEKDITAALMHGNHTLALKLLPHLFVADRAEVLCPLS